MRDGEQLSEPSCEVGCNFGKFCTWSDDIHHISHCGHLRTLVARLQSFSKLGRNFRSFGRLSQMPRLSDDDNELAARWRQGRGRDSGTGRESGYQAINTES